jgi:hypothetical protein
MRAVRFQGAKDIKVKNVDDPKIEKHEKPADAHLNDAFAGF